MIRELVMANREQVAFQSTIAIVVGKTVEKANKSFLDDVLASRATSESAFGERQETTLIQRD
jgi:hypothetical protein